MHFLQPLFDSLNCNDYYDVNKKVHPPKKKLMIFFSVAFSDTPVCKDIIRNASHLYK